MYPECYLDCQVALCKTYAYEPAAENVPATLRPHLLGVQGNMWGLGTPMLRASVPTDLPPVVCLGGDRLGRLAEARDFGNFTAASCSSMTVPTFGKGRSEHQDRTLKTTL